MEQWDFDNHLYEITEPCADRGYIAFIAAVDGSWIIRRKRFIADAAMRHEELIEGVPLGHDPDLSALIADRWRLRSACGEVYRRIRTTCCWSRLPPATFSRSCSTAATRAFQDAAAVLPEAAHLEVLSIDDRAVQVTGLPSEQPLYFLQHAFAFQVHDAGHPHHLNRHGRADIGWEATTNG